uniref:Putative trypsin-like serine protease n=1 Tax=Corethrella appendiculata TaxID=1370023 RepID=U5EZD4_9DIPT
MNKIIILSICLTLTAFSVVVHCKPTQNKVIGGDESGEHEFPYQVSLQWNDGFKPFHFCGGSIINERTVLTAGHCDVSYDRSGYREVVAGEHDFTYNKGVEQVRQITKFIVHEDYAVGEVGPNDIAIILLSKPFEFNEYVNAINLPIPDEVPVGNAILTGWGSISTNWNPEYPDVLRKVSLPIIEHDTCKKIYGNPDELETSNVCAGEIDGSKSGCSGDSGGPLVQKNAKNIVTQIGIVSWGQIPCGQKPTVFVRVSHFISWINKL